MLHKKTINPANLINSLNGTVRAEGSGGGGSVSDATWTDAAATFTTDGVVAGDVVFIDGEGEFTVSSVTSEIELELSGNLSATLSATSWRITYDRLISDFDTDVKLLSWDWKSRSYLIVYESDDFTVS
jgi:hypothetical protein